MWETRVWSLGREDPLEKEMATHSSILAWKSHGWRSMVGYCPWGRRELDTTERLHFHFEWPSGVLYLLQFKFNFAIRAHDLSHSHLQVLFFWLYRASPSLPANNVINQILVLTIWWCPCVGSSLVLLEEGVCYVQCVLLTKLF